MALPVSKIAFNKADKEKNGHLDRSEFKSLCYDMGHHLSEAELDAAVRKIDKGGNGQIEYEEFLQWWRTEDRFGKLHLNEEQMKQLQQASQYFAYFDQDRSGVLDKNEFKGLHADLTKHALTKGTYEHDLADLDRSGDGSIQFNEYIDWLVKIGSLPSA